MWTMTEQLKAEAFVREARPALMELTEGCVVRCGIEVNTFTITLGQQEVFEEPNEYTNKKYIANGGSNQWVRLSDKATTNIREIIGHPIALHHWLAVLPTSYELSSNGFLKEEIDENVWDIIMQFNMDTGQPATQADFKAFNDIVSVWKQKN